MSIKLDTRNFDRALKAFSETSRKTGQAILLDQARTFVRDVVTITPPNQDFKIQKGRGISAVRGDIAKVMKSTRKTTKVNPAEVHKKFRKERGRIRANLNNKGRDRRYRVNAAVLRDYVKKQIDKVGFLAAGWNAAAAKLGTRLPAWITKHGAKFGTVIVSLSQSGMRISISNEVPYAGNISGLQRRVQAALDRRAEKMRARMKTHALQEAAWRAGFKA